MDQELETWLQRAIIRLSIDVSRLEGELQQYRKECGERSQLSCVFCGGPIYSGGRGMGDSKAAVVPDNPDPALGSTAHMQCALKNSLRQTLSELDQTRLALQHSEG